MMSTIAYWPAYEWRTSQPYEQGMDSAILTRAYDYLRLNYPALREITIVRNGYVVFKQQNLAARESLASLLFRRLLARWGRQFKAPSEMWVDHLQDRWNIRSATKSITSIVVGIALGEGVIGGLDHKLANQLPDVFKDVAEPAKREITLRHLITMTSGLRMDESRMAILRALADRDWTRYALRLPLVGNPGETFHYNSANSHLLSAVITGLTGLNMHDYASRRLFAPMGIRMPPWGSAPERVTFGGGNLFLTSEELARIGYLVLRGGMWNAQQIVPRAWVEESLQPHQNYLPGWDYGYGWYLHDEADEQAGWRYRTWSAAGAGGQKLVVIPDLDLIMAVVTRTDFVDTRAGDLNHVIGKFLIPATDEARAQAEASASMVMASRPDANAGVDAVTSADTAADLGADSGAEPGTEAGSDAGAIADADASSDTGANEVNSSNAGA
jgi:CubicO group peptidase (beta-lactamase class C family)